MDPRTRPPNHGGAGLTVPAAAAAQPAAVAAAAAAAAPAPVPLPLRPSSFRHNIPPGSLRSHLQFAQHDDFMVRVGRVELSSYPPDDKQSHYMPLPDTLLTGPPHLLLVEHKEHRMRIPQWPDWALSEQGQRQRMRFRLMPDSSDFACQSWNLKVQHACQAKLYWQIDLPSCIHDASVARRNVYQLLVFPKQLEPSRHGKTRMWSVRAWLIHKHEVFPMLVPFNNRGYSADAWNGYAQATRAGPADTHMQQRSTLGPQATSAATAAGRAAPVVAGAAAAPAAAPAAVASVDATAVIPVAAPIVIDPAQVVAEAASLQQRYQSGGIFMYRALHSLSQMHEERPLGAIAELMDNSLDADAGSVHVDLTCFAQPEQNTLTFLDDGFGMSFSVLRSMLSEMGWSTKGGVGAPADQIGKYGQGFKTGVFRLGAAVIVLTKPRPDHATANESEQATTAAEPAEAATSSGAAAAALRPNSPLKGRPQPPPPTAFPADPAPSSSYPWSVGFLALPGTDCNPTPFSGSAEWNKPVVAHTLQYDPKLGLQANAQASWQEIVTRSSIKDVAALAAQFSLIKSYGTLIIISRLRVFDAEKQKMELQAGALSGKTNAATDDIQLKHLQTGKSEDASNSIEFSMRAFVSILYRKPRMRIVLQGHIVQLTNIEASLRRFKGLSNYHDRRQKYKLDLGFSDEYARRQLKGIMLYNGNRLISSFQFADLFVDWGHVGIIDTSVIRPEVDVVNNKQRYMASFAYLKLSAWIRVSCGTFQEHLETEAQNGGAVLEPETLHWIQCTHCRAWRTYPLSEHEALKQMGIFAETATWLCSQNTWDLAQASCAAPEPLWDATNEAASVESSGDAVEGKSKRTQLQRAMAQLAPPTLSLMEPRDFGQFLSQIRPENLLGRGSAAEVYQVLDGHRMVALKRFLLNLGGEAAGLKLQRMFERELMTQRTVTHPNVVAALGWVDLPNLCLLTEFVSGIDLNTALHGVAGVPSRRLALTATQKHGILVGIADGMTAIHREHIIHGDIKPANVMLEGVSRAVMASQQPSAESAQLSSEVIYCARICDFGLARRVKQQGQTITTNQHGNGQGTPAYMAPEQCGQDDDEDDETGSTASGISSQARKAADVWSFAILCVEVLTGAPVPLVSDPRVTEVGVSFPTSKFVTPGKGLPINWVLALVSGAVPWCDPNLPAIKPYFEMLRECFARDAAARPSFSHIFKQLQAVTFEQLHPDYHNGLAEGLLYRVLSHDDGRSSLAHGVRAKLEHSSRRPEDHVAYGSRMQTHFLSTTASFQWAIYYWIKVMIESKRELARCPWVIAVQLAGPDTPRVITYDMRNYLTASHFRAAFGHSADEVLIERQIPADCIQHVYDFSRSHWADTLLTFSSNCCTMVKKSGNALKGYTEWLSAMSQRAPFKHAWMSGQLVQQLMKDSTLQPAVYKPHTDEDNEEKKLESDETRMTDSEQNQQDGSSSSSSAAAGAAAASAAPTASASSASASSASSSASTTSLHYSVKRQRGDTIVISRTSSAARAPSRATAAATGGRARAQAGSKRKQLESENDDEEAESDAEANTADTQRDHSHSAASKEDESDESSSSDSSSSSSAYSSSDPSDDSSYCASDSDSDHATSSRHPTARAAAASTFKKRQVECKRKRTLFEMFRRRYYHVEYKHTEGAAAFNTTTFAQAARKRFTLMNPDEQTQYAAGPCEMPARQRMQAAKDKKKSK